MPQTEASEAKSTKDERVLAAARELFDRYGYKRTTMVDIATQAGMSRQTLYSSYPNKEAILRAAMIEMARTTAAEIEAGLESATDLGAQLRLVLEKTVLEPFVRIYSQPDATDLLEGAAAAGADVMEESKARYRAFTEGILEPHAARIAELGMTPERLARTLAASAAGLKAQAADADELRQALDDLVRLQVAALDVDR